jgi:hypothetical protein
VRESLVLAARESRVLTALFSRESWSETEFCFGRSFCFCESCELSLFPVKCREYGADKCSWAERHK